MKSLKNTEALASALLQVIALSEKQLERMGRQAKERVMCEFSMEKCALKQRLKKLYLESKT